MLSDDIADIDPQTIKDVQVTATIVGGNYAQNL